MGSIEVFTKERMLQIEKTTVVNGLVDASGNLILRDRQGTAINAGSVKGPKGDAGYTVIGAYPGGAGTYVRLAVIDGNAELQGAHIQFLLSGLGNYGTAARATVLVHGVQRGANGFSLMAWGVGMETAAVPLTLYMKQIGTFQYEIWALLAPFNMQHGLTLLAMSGGWVTVDGATTTAPTGLAAVTIQPWIPNFDAIKDKPLAYPAMPLNYAKYVPNANPNEYPMGTSNTLVEPNAGWPHPNNYGNLVTVRSYSANGGTIQYWSSYQGDDSHVYHRQWFYNTSAWSAWQDDTPGVTALDGRMSQVTGDSYIAMTDIVMSEGFGLPNTSTIQVRNAGRYLITASQLISAPSASYYKLQINGGTVAQAYNTGTMTDMNVIATKKIPAGGTIRFYYQGPTPSSWTSDHTNISVVKVT